MGQAEERILKECYAWNRPIPDRITNAPELLLGLEMYYEAYAELNTCRSVSWSAGPIPWTAVQEYSIVNEFDAEETHDLHFFIQKMDHAFLKRMDKKAKSA